MTIWTQPLQNVIFDVDDNSYCRACLVKQKGLSLYLFISINTLDWIII